MFGAVFLSEQLVEYPGQAVAGFQYLFFGQFDVGVQVVGPEFIVGFYYVVKVTAVNGRFVKPFARCSGGNLCFFFFAATVELLLPFGVMPAMFLID